MTMLNLALNPSKSDAGSQRSKWQIGFLNTGFKVRASRFQTGQCSVARHTFEFLSTGASLVRLEADWWREH